MRARPLHRISGVARIGRIDVPWSRNGGQQHVREQEVACAPGRVVVRVRVVAAHVVALVLFL